MSIYTHTGEMCVNHEVIINRNLKHTIHTSNSFTVHYAPIISVRNTYHVAAPVTQLDS